MRFEPMKWRAKISGSLGLAIAGLLLLAAPASATLIDNGISMHDDATNLEWLDLTETLGDSVDTALGANPTFTLATDAQVLQLFTNAGFGLPLVNGALAADYGPALDLLNFLGCTAAACGGNFPYGRGIADNTGAGADLEAGSYSIQAIPDNGDAIQHLLFNGTNVSFADRGVYLVRDIPEPSLALLVSLGLVALTVRGRLSR